MTAQEARNLAEAVRDQRNNASLTGIRGKIRAAASEGYFCVFVSEFVDDATKAALEHDGFKVRQWSDMREGDGAQKLLGNLWH